MSDNGDLQNQIDTTNDEITDLTSQIQTLQNSSDNLENSLTTRTDTIQTAQTQLQNQQKLLEEKRALLITRNRMLQLSQDRNFYKQRVIYTLISLIFAAIVIILIGYAAFKK